VGSRESGNVELLTLTLSFLCNRKRYDLAPGVAHLLCESRFQIGEFDRRMGAIDIGGFFDRQSGLARLRHRGNFRPLRRSRFGSFFAQFSPGGFFNRLQGANDTGRVFAPGNSLGDLLGDSLGSFPRSTPGEFSLGDSLGSRARSPSPLIRD
ncbi:hypothetical protein QUB76_37375, partial [Microcoleus sp. D2B6]|uniref:hypothetical protein n=1 Tax=unclassified Microcoleus TaxID=2642155 RepID=UPI002FD0BFBC